MWFGPGAATLVFVIGLFLAIAPALPHDRTWARSLMALCGSALLLRYVAWRVGATLQVDGLGMAGQLWVWTCLGAELLLIFDNFLSLLVMSRWADRSHEADRHCQRLRSTPATSCRRWTSSFPPTTRIWRSSSARSSAPRASTIPMRASGSSTTAGAIGWRSSARRKGVGYLRRPDNRHAKAGNINHALGLTDGSSWRSSMPTSCRIATFSIARSASSRTRASASCRRPSASSIRIRCSSISGRPACSPRSSVSSSIVCCPAVTPGTPLSVAAPTV